MIVTIKKKVPPKSVLDDAKDITNTGHGGQYPPWEYECITRAAILNALYPGLGITSAQVNMGDIVMKQVREAHRHKRDNLTDICGYTRLLSKLEGDEA